MSFYERQHVWHSTPPVLVSGPFGAKVAGFSQPASSNPTRPALLAKARRAVGPALPAKAGRTVSLSL